MSRSFILPVVSLCLLLFAVNHVFSRQRPVEQTTPPTAPPETNVSDCVAGAGIVEPKTENMLLGSHLPGIIEKVNVVVGQVVQPGQPLFELDSRQIAADVEVKRAELDAAYAELGRLEQMPRPEDVPPIVAQRREAEAVVAEMQDAYDRNLRLGTSGASTEEKLVSSRTKLDGAKAQLERMRAEEARLLAGAWDADKALSRAKVQSAQRSVEQLETELSRYTVNAPNVISDGETVQKLEVLQVNVRPGEAVAAAPGNALIILGDVSRKHVRVDIDEHDIPRFRKDAPAMGIVRGESRYQYDLKFVRLEPYVIPKRSLTGDNRERVDTRVLQAIYEVVNEPADRPVYIGQQLDVFIDVTQGQTASKPN
ncbi:HlyD family secretion protein [Planctomicrobium piriforme]|uniref:Biotin-lipoyl like n=1 Tax=Planctomicrobium piriforme TaxID=1576369 RepID=A0A1I3EP36_9PLAN|nr:biotin/lipoyl-binding protein [Planctomicrobium piriforme]SFI00776.1 Biotin-lipoyl like [Planctomicrobium piriforme]